MRPGQGFYLFSWVGVKWAISRNVIELLMARRGARVGKKKEASLGHDSSLFNVDNIARERNMRCLDGIKFV